METKLGNILKRYESRLDFRLEILTLKELRIGLTSFCGQMSAIKISVEPLKNY